MNAYLTVLSKYATFQGRARRSEYWQFTLINLLIGAALYLFALESEAGLVIYSLFAISTILPTFAVATRRLHDSNRSGWWQLLIIVPFGVIALLVFYCQEGTAGTNRFGDDPKAVDRQRT